MQIRIGNKVYSYEEPVVIVDDELGDDNRGIIHYENHETEPLKIKVKKGYSPEVWAEVLLHECIHGICRESNFEDDSIFEEHVRMMGIASSMFLKQNPHFFDLCRKHLFYDDKYENVPDPEIMPKVHFGAYSYELLQVTGEADVDNLPDGKYVPFQVCDKKSKMFLYGDEPKAYWILIQYYFYLMLHSTNRQFNAGIPSDTFSRLAEGLAKLLKENRWVFDKLEKISKKSNKTNRINFKKYENAPSTFSE
ncbi:hypothetical protein [Bacillus sp. KH172YL63]|uniref:hypothetical protein n=1 Tax=Bacillus sp. KH172YL63 TaxID=2709784 RepID=UPI0013E436D6|nr:hypothetical protein [Bacillus sp. KH172YL63]BCB03512.1 hypothetical protein KH172YL63_16450 [Bacillus sp. KH172YL63]